MKHILCVALLVFSFVPLHAQITDDFSGGDWKQFANTPGTMTVEAGKLYLRTARRSRIGSR